MPQLDTVLAQVDSFFAKADAVADGRQITSGKDGNVKPGDKITQEWNGKAWKTVDPKSPAKGPRETQTWTGSRWDADCADADAETVKGPDGKSYPKGTRFIPIDGKVRPILPGNNVPKAADSKADADPSPTWQRKISELKRRLGSASSAQQREMRAEISELEEKLERFKASDRMIRGMRGDVALAAADALFAKADAVATGRKDAGDINNPKSGYYIWQVRFYVSWSRAAVREYYAVCTNETTAKRLAEQALKKDYGRLDPEDNYKITGTKKGREVSDYTAKTYGNTAMGSDAYPK